MEKVIYWIDDDIANILNLAEDIFPFLWDIESKDNIINRIILFGNEQQKGMSSGVLTDKREMNITYKLEDIFKKECDKIEQGLTEHKLFKEKKHLTDGMFNLFKKDITGEIDENRKKEQQHINTINDKVIECWENEEELTSDSDSIKKDMDALIEAFDIPDYAFVAIDMILLYGDDKRVKKGNKILSMELYNRFSNGRSGGCFVYSRYISDVQLANDWKSTFKNHYPCHGGEVRLYKRKDLNVDDIDGMNIVKELKDEMLNGENSNKKK